MKTEENFEIAYVDDCKDEIFIAQHYLKRSSLNTTTLKTFMSGEEFLEFMKQVKKGEEKIPKLVLLDIRMPGMDGFEVLEEIRKQEEFKSEPKIMMFSNSDAPSDVKKAYEYGANGYKTKPTGKDEFISFFNSLAADLK